MRKPVVERTAFAKRLIQAREYAGLTQTALAKAVGMAQSTYGEAETTAHGSRKTAQLAAKCGVSADWLATGKGAMHSEAANAEVPLPPQTEDLPRALVVVAKAIATPTGARLWLNLEPLYSRLAREPDQFGNIAQQINKLADVGQDAVTVTDDVSRSRSNNKQAIALPESSNRLNPRNEQERHSAKTTPAKGGH